MSSDSTDGARASAIDQLESFGLSSYAAETFVTLVGLGHGTAKEVSEASAVPRTRVYDAVAELENRSLVDVEDSSPQTFRPVSVETTRRRFAEDSQRRIDRMTDALAELEPDHAGEIQQGVWTVRGEQAVTDRIVALVDDADVTVRYAAVDGTPSEAVIDSLQAAADRGVSVQPAGGSETARRQLGESFESVRTATPAETLAGERTGHIAMADGERILVSVLPSDRSRGPDVETAIWATGSTNSLVSVLQAAADGQFVAPPEE